MEKCAGLLLYSLSYVQCKLCTMPPLQAQRSGAAEQSAHLHLQPYRLCRLQLRVLGHEVWLRACQHHLADVSCLRVLGHGEWTAAAVLDHAEIRVIRSHLRWGGASGAGCVLCAAGAASAGLGDPQLLWLMLKRVVQSCCWTFVRPPTVT